jgi:hypothetical protein
VTPIKSKCEHKHFKSMTMVHRTTKGGEVEHYMAEIRINCADCGAPFEFKGPQTALNFNMPGVATGGMMVRCPIKPNLLCKDFWA